MPGPGQGNQTQKKKQSKNVFNLNANMAAVNAVMMALGTAAPNASPATSELLPTNKATTTAPPPDGTAPNTGLFTPTIYNA
jgi:hypothetical protein